MAQKTAKFSASSTSWRVVADDGVDYASLAALTAASKKPFPGLDPGAFASSVLARSEGAAGADGSAFWIQLGGATAPADTTQAHLVSGAGQTLSLAGMQPPNFVIQIRVIWIKKTVGADSVVLTAIY